MGYTKRFGEDLLNGSVKIFELTKITWKERGISEEMWVKVEADFQKYIHACKEVFGKRDDFSLKEKMEEIKERLPKNLWLQMMICLKTNKFLIAGGKSVMISPEIRERAEKLRKNDGRYTVH